MDTANAEICQLSKRVDELSLSALAAEQDKKSAGVYLARLEEHMDGVQDQLRSCHEAINAKEKEVQDVEALLRATQRLLEASETDREKAMSMHREETRLRQEESRELERVGAELDRTAGSLAKLRQDGDQKAAQIQSLQRQMQDEKERAEGQLNALKGRISSALGDKTAVVMKLHAELQSMARWKEEQKEQKEEAQRRIEKIQAEFAAERESFAERERGILQGFESEKLKFAADQVAEVERLRREAERAAAKHKEELEKRDEAQAKTGVAHAHQLLGLKKELTATASELLKGATKLERVEAALKSTAEELNANNERFVAMQLELTASSSDRPLHSPFSVLSSPSSHSQVWLCTRDPRLSLALARLGAGGALQCEGCGGRGEGRPRDRQDGRGLSEGGDPEEVGGPRQLAGDGGGEHRRGSRGQGRA